MKTKLTTMLLAVAMLPAVADEAKPCAFGYCMGQAMEQDPTFINSDGISVLAVDHALFDPLTVHWTPATGVCKLLGIVNINSPDKYGTLHKAKFRELVGYVERKYGKPSGTTDRLLPNSIWKRQGDWLMAVKRRERQLGAQWKVGPIPSALRKRGYHAVDLPKGIDEIAILVDANKIGVYYEFFNYVECKEKGKAAAGIGADF